VHGYAWYRFSAAFNAPIDRAYGLYLSETLSNVQLYVNGQFAGQLGALEGMPPDDWDAVHLFALPPSLLRPGRNQFDLRLNVRPGDPGGIGRVVVGLEDDLRVQARRDQFWHSTGPAVASLGMLVLGAFVLMLWIREQGNQAYLFFAAGSALWGLHTAIPLLYRQLLAAPHYAVWWNSVYVLWVMLLCIFSLRFVGAGWKRFERIALGYAAAAPVLLYLSAAMGSDPPLSDWIRLGAIGLVIVALWAVIDHALRHRDTHSWLLLLASAMAAAFGLRDWLVDEYRTQLRPVALVPFVATFYLAFISWLIIDRFVKTSRQFERLNLELERRVAEKSQALEVELTRQAMARRAAEAANLAKTRFLAAASHDLRQPLHALGIFAAALEPRSGDLNSRELVAQMNRSIASLEGLFNEVLDITRLDAGAMQANVRAVPLQPLFSRLAAELMPAAEQKGLALRFVPTARSAWSDPVLLERILRNLVNNAVRYTDAGAILVGVRHLLQGRQPGVVPGLVLEVRDSGVGIDADQQLRVFEEFYRVGGNLGMTAAVAPGEVRDRSAEADRANGLGLGLSIVARLCELLGHQVTLRSAPGCGSCFRLHLPAAQPGGRAIDLEPMPVPTPKVEVSAPISPAPGLAGQVVVVIDDDPEVRAAMQRLLAEWQMVPVAVATAELAMAKVAELQRAPSLLIVDYRLGAGRNGLDAAAQLRATWSASLPVLVISGESSASALARIQDSGFPLLPKPVAPAKLRSIVAHLLSPVAD
jgi:signal transduction histidine kinase/CheY-like chemotaxis protein